MLFCSVCVRALKTKRISKVEVILLSLLKDFLTGKLAL